jgi:hypothetical protein
MTDPGSAATASLDDPLQEALRLVGRAEERGLMVRLMGGLAFHALVPGWSARIAREGRDIDLATRGRDSRDLSRLLAELGYAPDKQYNALYGHKQLYFVDPSHARPLDVLVDRLEMCHRLEFGDRLGLASPTLEPTDLLLTKLQVVQINRKDLLDILALLSEVAVSGERVAEITAQDWGWWRTVTGNLENLDAFIANELRPEELDVGHPARFSVSDQIDGLRAAIDAAPKSTRWRLRARIGDRMPWYEEPEEVGHGR